MCIKKEARGSWIDADFKKISSTDDEGNSHIETTLMRVIDCDDEGNSTKMHVNYLAIHES